MAQATSTLTPTQVASKLAGAENAAKVAKTFVRPYLRKHFTRKGEVKGTSWALTPEMVKEITNAYKARKSETKA